METKNKKITIAILTALIVTALVATGFFAYFEFLGEEEITEETEPVEEIDDRISPLENQGLILEVKRIRHRGLLDEMLKMGRSWRNKPTFYFISNVDGLEYVTDSEILYKTWDTMFQENKVMRDVEEEQETSEVTITIMERVKKGIFRTQDVERDKIRLTYDYRTGRWTGDDSFKDDDGYGHYVGETFEVWFNIYQTDKDGDGIPYWTEVNVLHTDPWIDDSKQDPDEDGIPTAWEWRWGYDPHVWDYHMKLDPDIDGIENIEEYQMAKWFADPFAQDIYIEADGMKRKGLFDPPHVFFEESQQVLIERFCRHGMNVYIDDGWPGGPTNGGGEILPQYVASSQDSGVILQYYNNHFADERKGIFRYLVVGCDQPAFNHPAKFNRYDAMHVVNSLKLNLLMRAFTPRTQRLMLTVLVQHELGHSLGITPWSHEGCDNISYSEGRKAKEEFLEKWGNYYSCMNYYYSNQMGRNLLFEMTDYSDGSHGPGDQNDWEMLYLPCFQTESRVIEEVFFEPPCVDKIVDEKLEFEVRGWNYSEELTHQYVKDISGWSPVDPIDVNWRVYEKTDEDTSLSDRNIRVYAQPDIPFSEWVLIKEGHVGAEGSIQLF